MWLGCGVFGACRGCGCVPAPVLLWAWVFGGMGVRWLMGSGFPVCVSALRHLVASGLQGAGPGGAGGGWLASVVAWRLRGWSPVPRSAWVAWPDAGVRVGAFMAWDVWVVGTPLLGAGRLVWAWLVCLGGGMGRGVCWVCVRQRRGWLGWGTVGDAMGGGDAGDAHKGGCCRRRNGLVLLMWVLQAMRRAVTGLVLLMVL